MIRKKNKFLVNSEIYHIDTRQHANFHQPSANVTGYQKGVYYLGVKVFKRGEGPSNTTVVILNI
jgi:hypothetical protein